MIIAIEGLDGAGKGTLCRLLTEKLADWSKISTHPYRVVSFPQYEQTFFAKMVSHYLNGDLGTLEELPVHLTASLYAGDRFESRHLFANSEDRQEIILLDRYVASNMAYQCARRPQSEWAEIADWIYEYEMVHLGLPKPDLNILLHSSPEISHYLVAQKQKRAYTDKSHDILENHAGLLAQAEKVYAFLVQTDRPGPWSVVSIRDGQETQEMETDPPHAQKLRPPQEIADQVWQIILEAHSQR